MLFLVVYILFTLIKNGYSIANAANKCGYNDYSSFIRAFTKEYRMSPTIYIKNYENQS